MISLRTIFAPVSARDRRLLSTAATFMIVAMFARTVLLLEGQTAALEKESARVGTLLAQDRLLISQRDSILAMAGLVQAAVKAWESSYFLENTGADAATAAGTYLSQVAELSGIELGEPVRFSSGRDSVVKSLNGRVIAEGSFRSVLLFLNRLESGPIPVNVDSLLIVAPQASDIRRGDVRASFSANASWLKAKQ